MTEAPGVTETEPVVETKKCATCDAAFSDADDRRYKDCAVCRVGNDAHGIDAQPASGASGLAHVIKVIPVAIPKSDRSGPTRRYWCGVRRESPFSSVVLAGFGFIKQQGKLDHDDENVAPTFRGRKGEDLNLTDVQVEAIRDAVACRIVRSFGRGRGARYGIMTVGSHAYRHDPSDQPLGMHVYMVRVDGQMPADYREQDPEPMVG